MENDCRPSGCRKWISRLVRAWLWLALLGMSGWGALAIYYSNLPTMLRAVLAALFVLAALAALILVRPRRRGLVVFGVMFALLVAWWFTIPASNTRDWLPDVAVLPYAGITNNLVSLHNIRNCDYRSETDYHVRHYDKTFNLDKLRTTDLYLVYWGSPNIAHTMVSFGFDGGDYVCMSIETRKEKGESYSAVKGLFRQFELIYIIADERDLVRLRTNYRQGEDAYLYRARMTPEQGRRLFLDYLRRANELRERPEWYNALTDNCTTAIRTQRAAADRAPWDWRMLVNGHLDELLYKRATIATNLPFADLKKECHINARARAAEQAADFSQLIRQGLPDPNL